MWVTGWPIVPGPQSSSDKRQKGSGDKHLGGGEGACTDLRRASPRRAGPEGVQVDLGSTPSFGDGPMPEPLGQTARGTGRRAEGCRVADLCRIPFGESGRRTLALHCPLVMDLCRAPLAGGPGRRTIGVGLV